MKMTLFMLLLICASDCCAEPRTCLIVKHASTAHQFLVSGANWQFVAGDFPKGMKWKSNITDRNIRKVKEMGGKVITLQPNYSAEDLAQAQRACEVP